MHTLHLIASRPSHGERHVDPVDPRVLGRHCSRDEALTAGYSYLEQHPCAWLQIEGPDGSSEDVS